jgi:CAAX prenyl protease-like protein
LPFAIFMGFLAVNPVFPVPQWARFVLEAGVIAAVSRQALAARPTRVAWSILLGVAVFAIWIGPDQIYPAYRSLPLFSNAVTGHAIATTTLPQRHNAFFLTFRILNSVMAIPILEELFWRGFLMRWLIGRDFRTVPLGAWSAEAFWIVALLFASEHGPYWDVGLIAGVIYNWWMLRTRNLWDCIIAHAVTNACLAAWVIGAGQWQYWM